MVKTTASKLRTTLSDHNYSMTHTSNLITWQRMQALEAVRCMKKSSKLELRDKVGGLGGGASVRTSRGPALPCCCVRGTQRGRRTKPCVNMNGYKSQYIMR